MENHHQGSAVHLLSLEASLLDLRESMVLELQKLREMEAFAAMNADYYSSVNKAEQALVILDRDLQKLGTKLEGRRSAGRLKPRKRQALKSLWVRLWNFLRRRPQPGQ